MEWVVKISKLCNLRCEYCYEYNWLGEKARISLKDISSFFANVRRYAQVNSCETQEFIWHGGEPMLFSVDYYRSIFQLQEEIFGQSGVEVKNRIQTNLYRLTPDWLEFLSSGAFDSIGVSFDGVGDLRLTARGGSSTERVAENVQRMKDAGISFGLLTVLSRSTLPYVEDIFDFAAAIGSSLRFIPIYREAEGRSNSEMACSAEDVVDAYERVYLRWLKSDARIDVQPLGALVRNIIRAVKGGEPRRYEKSRDNKVFIVNTDGTLYGNADPYAEGAGFLNVFDDDIMNLASSESWKRSLEKSASRVSRICSSCSFLGICDGYPVAEATEYELSSHLGAEACNIVRPTLKFMVRHSENAVRDQITGWG